MATKKKLHGPSLKGDLKTVKELVNCGVDVNEKDSYSLTEAGCNNTSLGTNLDTK